MAGLSVMLFCMSVHIRDGTGTIMNLLSLAPIGMTNEQMHPGVAGFYGYLSKLL